VRANRPEVDLQEGLFFGSKSVEAGNTIRFRKDGEGRAPRFLTSVVLDFSKLHDSKCFFQRKTVTFTLAVREQLQISSKSPKASSGAPNFLLPKRTVGRFLGLSGCTLVIMKPTATKQHLATATYAHGWCSCCFGDVVQSDVAAAAGDCAGRGVHASQHSLSHRNSDSQSCS